MSGRKSADAVFLEMAVTLSQRGTCARRRVGCIITDAKGRIIASGYNGNAPGMEHCIDVPCPGRDCPSGTGLELCEAIHAEQNALVQCLNRDAIHTVYTTHSPCMHCIKMIATTSAQRIVFIHEYPHYQSRGYWESRGGEWIQLDLWDEEHGSLNQ